MKSTGHMSAQAIGLTWAALLLAGGGCADAPSAHSAPAHPAPSKPADMPTPEPVGSEQRAAASGQPASEATATAPPALREAASDEAAAPADHAAPKTAAEPPRKAPAETPKPTPPPADRGPRRPGDAEKITFDDLNLGMQADIVFRPIMLSVSDRVNELVGRRVSIVGYMHGGQETQRGITKFILLKNTQCKFGPGGQADHLTDVWLRDGITTNLTTSPLKVEGILRIEPFQGNDGNTWSIYRLEDAQIR